MIWSFPKLEIAPEEGEFINVVKIVHWKLSASANGAPVEMIGAVALSEPDGVFTDFHELTPEIVEGWVKRSLGEEGVAQAEAEIARQIADRLDPVLIQVTPPWTW